MRTLVVAVKVVITLGDLDAFLKISGVLADLLNFLDYFLPSYYLPKYSMLPIKPRAWDRSDKELRGIRVFTTVSHRENKRLVMIEMVNDLVLELITPE